MMITSIDIDTVVLSCYGTYDYTVLVDKLPAYREIAKIIDDDYPCPAEFWGWSIKPFGSPAKGFSYIMRRGDVRVLVSKGNGETAPNMRIEIGSLSCHGHHLPTLISEIHGIFSYECKKEKLTRADLCRDVECDFGLHRSSVVDPQNWYWNRKVKFTPYYDGDRFTGVQLGRGDVVARLYDKSYELLCNKKKNVRKIDFYSNYYGLDLDKTTVYRLEYQMRREYFRSVEVETLEDLLTKKEEVWGYLTKVWCFFSGKKVKRCSGHSSSESVESSPSWEPYLGDSKPAARKAPRAVTAVSDRIFKQGFGCIMSYVLAETDTDDIKELYDSIMDYVHSFMETQLKLGLGSVMNRYERRLQNYRNLNHDVSYEVPF